ncbi:MAG: Gfo/Idh/MocA family oxidoreductase [Cyclobacteriaceae bacterium]|nr:Gfo/Idh/MocA family oxidoreductase [Cyclobacteriaceae bacterium]
MEGKIRWGILGCGKIANKFAADLRWVDDAELQAVASRDNDKGKVFAQEHGASLVFDSYEALAASDQVDVIYVATPHGFHYEHVMLCLKHRKAVLCEKAFALNTRQAMEMIGLANQQKIFLMEAFWTKFIPQYQRVRELILAGEIGEVKMIQADFGFKADEPPAQRLYDPVLGGGSLLDVGIYPVFLAISLLGKPTEIQATVSRYSTGVDEQCAMTMKFESGALASLNSTFAADTPVEAVISGTKGRLHMRNRFHNAVATVELVRGKESPVLLPVHREEGFGYQFEARHVGECLRQGLTESPVMTHADTRMLMETLDRIRNVCGISYSVD